MNKILQINIFVFVILINFVELKKNVFCFYHKSEQDTFDIKDIDAKLCTHLVYDFFGISPKTGKFAMIKSFPNWTDVDETITISNLQSLKSQNPELKILLSAGYWDISKKYSEMAKDSNKRKIFIDSAFRYIVGNNFDGLDLSWKWPGKRSGDKDNDIENHANLIFELNAMRIMESRPLILTAIVNPIPYYAKLSYRMLEISNLLDFIILATYDMSNNQNKTGLGSPIFQNKQIKSILLKNKNIENILKFWIQEGIPSEKLILGISSYGNAYTAKLDENYTKIRPGSIAVGPGQPYDWTVYNKFCIKLKTEPWIVNWDNFLLGEYAQKGNLWIEFDSLKSVDLKTRLANQYKLGGIMLNAIKYDDYSGNCEFGDKYPLLKTINSILHSNVSFPKFEYILKVEITKINIKHNNYTQTVHKSEQSTFLD